MDTEVVVITGASAGVGRATALCFARIGAQIGLIARESDALEATRREVEAAGGRAIVCPADVADAAAVEAAAAAVERDLGPIGIWINNAMTTVFAPFDQITPEEFRRVTEVTYLGFVYGTMSALRRMKPRDSGIVVQVGSALAYRSIPLQSAYCGAKHAVVGFTDSIRSELIHDHSHVQITVVHLPAMNTPQFEWCRTKLPRHPQPVPPILQPEVAAEAIYWATHADRREVSVGFSTVKAIEGQKVAAGYADRYLARNGYEAQQTSEPVPASRPDNLFEPVEGKHRTHGRFDAQASAWSAQMWLNTHRSAVVLIGGAIMAAAVAALRRVRV